MRAFLLEDGDGLSLKTIGADLAVTDAEKSKLIEIRQGVDPIKGSVPLPGAMEMWVVRESGIGQVVRRNVALDLHR